MGEEHEYEVAEKGLKETEGVKKDCWRGLEQRTRRDWPIRIEEFKGHVLVKEEVQKEDGKAKEEDRKGDEPRTKEGWEGYVKVNEEVVKGDVNHMGMFEWHKNHNHAAREYYRCSCLNFCIPITKGTKLQLKYSC